MFISELDIIGQDYKAIDDQFSDTSNTTDEKGSWDLFFSRFAYILAADAMLEPMFTPLVAKAIDPDKRIAEEKRKDDIEEVEKQIGDEEKAALLVDLIESMGESYPRSFCARMIYPFLEAATQSSAGPNHPTLDFIYNRKIEELNILTASLETTTSRSSEKISKFLLILSGTVTNVAEKDTADCTSDSQKLLNTVLREAFTALSEDPQSYVLHSYYDMLVNDKRGRLLRAFPTYYVTFIDEGRKIGSWKLFDNFYNMSAIADLTVTKSRKIPTDTCTFTMTNMFNSYASEYDNTTRENYVDVYSLRDTFTSIFSPKSYVMKEDALARRKNNTETTVLQPGVRIHVRMGYGANATALPTVFNGRIAEIDVGDVVSVVCQGDGSELVNPLNALGDIEATSIIEAQQWTTIAKDLRGSLSRGGLSPRNLLVQLLTAQHGGLIKTSLREWSDDRFYSDNPFGIYHFGDKRFADIFTEGEVVQNLYEVVDGTLMQGANELFQSEAGVSYAIPTLNTTIQDKTFWDILTLCAYSGDGYIGAVRDFGFRSTVFLGRPNHYYAYAYVREDGKWMEKRKPFQQFHYFDSYTDIIYNSIKASDKNIKTNATGIYEGTDYIWGQEQKTCGPIYLDINIYPEYQKAMTVDTGLVAAGNGGIDIPVFNAFSEDWNMNADADKVNKSLAERITKNALRESLTNMYTGEVCVIGNPAIKPYDRFYLHDTYEDMMGQMEVEAVVYSMNFNTGFTTTVYPDMIVRADDNYEKSAQFLNATLASTAISTVAVGIARNLLFDKEAKWITSLAGALSKINKTEIKSIQMLSSFLKLDKADDIVKMVKNLKYAGTLSSLAYNGAVAAAIYIVTNNCKASLTRWVRNIQSLDLYPVMKNKRPFVAGINGHKGCVVGYGYTATDANDSVQGMIVNCINNLSKATWGISDVLLASILDQDVYRETVSNWSNTLTTLQSGLTEEEVKESIQKEQVKQDVYKTASTEFSSRSANLRMNRTKYRLRSFSTNGGKSKTYQKYRNLAITTSKRVKADEKSGTPVVDGIEVTSIYSNKNVLSLCPIEDDSDVKKAVAGSHPVVKNMTISHGLSTVSPLALPFESGPRNILYIPEGNPNSTYADFPILDMPMLQEDALYVLKFILNSDFLKDKEVVFLSGARLNDTRSWKNTGFAFEVQSNDTSALKKAIDSVKKETVWTLDGKQVPIFAYQQTDDVFVITVYPEAAVEDYNK